MARIAARFRAATRMIVLFIIFQAFLWLPWWLLVHARAGGLSRAEQGLLASLFYFAQVIGSTVLLALLGVLTPTLLFGVNLALAAALGGLAWKSSRPLRLGGHFPSSLGFLGAGGLRFFNLALIGLLATALGLVVYHGRLYAPFTYDDLNYRLPIACAMLQNRAYAIWPVHMDIIDAYPRNMECWFYWFLAFFRADRWVDLSQLAFLPLCLLAVYSLARRLRASRPAALAAALVFSFAPVVLAQLMTAYADIGYTAFILAALASLLWLEQGRTPLCAAGFGVAVGLALGTKFSGGPYAAILIAFFLLQEWRRGRTERKPILPGLAARLGIVLAMMLLVGGYPYLRNLALHTNPLYPYKIPLFASFALPGSWDPDGGLGLPQTVGMSPLGRLARSWSDVMAVNHSGLFGGFGFTWPLLLGCSAASLALAVRARDGRRQTLFLMFTLLFLATPLNFRCRYTIFLLGLGGVSLAHLLDLSHGRRLPQRALLGAVLLACVLTVGQVYGAYWGGLFALDRKARQRAADPCAHAKPREFRDAYRYVRGKIQPGATVYYFGRRETFTYCLWRRDFTNTVRFAEPASEEEFLKLARSQPAAWLFIPLDMREGGWLKKNRGHFELRFERPEVAVAQWRE